MDIKIKREEGKNVIPEVGQFWKYVDDDKVYYRIKDEYGKRFVGHNIWDHIYFYSLDPSNDKMEFTYYADRHIILLKQDGPLVLSPV